MSIEGFAAQGELFGVPRPPAREAGWDDKVYFALLPDPHAKRALLALGEQLALRHGLSGRPNPETLHVSVLGVGYCRALTLEDLAVAEAAAEALACRPFPLTFTSLASDGRPKRGGRHPVVLRCGEGADGVAFLADALRGEMTGRGLEPGGPSRSQPHLTLLHDHRELEARPLDPPITMDVEGVALVRNHEGQGRHDVRIFPFRSRR